MNEPQLQVKYTSAYGELTWMLPPNATKALTDVPPKVQARALEAFGSNLTTLCGAMLKSFGNPGIVETLNLIMREVQDINERG